MSLSFDNARCRPAPRVAVCALLISSVFSLPACGPAASLEGALPSAEALAVAVLDAIASNDRAALDALALSEAEFRQRIYPELPASKPERNLSADYLWRDLRQKSGTQLADTLATHGGRRYTLVRVTFLGETTSYQTFQVRRKAQLIVRDDSGGEQSIRLFGSVLRVGSAHKVFSFVVD